MDEVASVNEKMEEKMEGIEEEMQLLKEELQEEKAARYHLARQYGELFNNVREIQRQLRLAQAAPPSRRSSGDETDSEWEQHAIHLAVNQAVRRAQTMVEFEGRLVPIGEPDCAESPPRSIKVIDLTGEPKVIVRATLPSALNVMNASAVGKLVQLVTASRLILYHEG